MAVARACFPFSLILAGAVLVSGTTLAHDAPRLIEVFTDSRTPVRTHGVPATVYRLDRIRRLQEALSRGLPVDPKAAKRIVLRRFQRMDARHSSELEESAKGLALAMQYGLVRYPAIVLDGESVVYGITDVRNAIRFHAQWQQGSRNP